MHNFGNVHISSGSSNEMLKKISNRLANKQKTTVFFTNAHCYNVAQKDDVYREILNSTDFNLNDGIGVELGGRLLGVQFKENLNGTDFTPKVLEMAGRNGYRVYLLGGGSGIAKHAKNNLKTSIPKLQIIGCNDGYFGDSNLVIEDINTSKADIVIVGMGVPTQEKWIAENAHKTEATLFMGVGAFLDFAAENVRRAPFWIRKCRMEWFYRLLLEPRRMWRRYLLGNLTFFYNIIKNKRSEEAH